MPFMKPEDAALLVRRRHPEWIDHQTIWRWLQDSLEGGHRYKVADYALPGQPPQRNLFRHSRETPPPIRAQEVYSGDPTRVYAQATALEQAALSTYDTRLARTPVPGFVAEVVDKYVSKIFNKEIAREGPDPLMEWWEDVDGKRTTIDEWMTDTIAPLLITLGQLDLVFQHPAAPQGVTVQTEADVTRYGLRGVRANYILPENLLWWWKDDEDQYLEGVVQEYWETPDGKTQVVYRWWNEIDCTIFDIDGVMIGQPVPHPYGKPPLLRIYDRRKFRCRNVGHSRMEGPAERARDYYNRDSELIINDTLQASPPLSGPVEFLTGQHEVIVGPGYMLPKFRGADGNYEGWEYVTLDKSGDESLRSNMDRRRDEIDRETALTKPAGAAAGGGTNASTVSQSGISKAMDSEEGGNVLAKLAKALAKAERLMSEWVIKVASNGTIDARGDESIVITYPTSFNLLNGTEQMSAVSKFQGLVIGTTGEAPETEAAMLKRSMRVALEGENDTQLAVYDDEIERLVSGRSERRNAYLEGSTPDESSVVPRPNLTSILNAATGSNRPNGSLDPLLVP